MCGYLQGLFEVYLMLLDWGKPVLVHPVGRQGHLFSKHHDFSACMEGNRVTVLVLLAARPGGTWLDDLFASQTGRTGHFPPSMMIHFVRHGQAAGRCDCHSLSPVMSQPPSAGCETRAACRYLFIKPFAAVATFSQLCCLTPMGDPSFLPGEHQVSL